MKKIFTVFLAAIILSSMCVTTSSAKSEENISNILYDTLSKASALAYAYDVREEIETPTVSGNKFTSDVIRQYMVCHEGIGDDYEQYKEEYDDIYAVPAPIFEAVVAERFLVDETLLNELRVRLNEDTNTYDYYTHDGHGGEGYDYAMYGFIPVIPNQEYDVYVARYCYDDEPLDNFTGLIENVDYVGIADGDCFLFRSYAKVNVTRKGTSIRFNSFEYLDKLPDLDFIQKNDTYVEDDVNGCSARADLGVFPEETVVNFTKLTEGDTYNYAKAAMEKKAEKFTVLEITATSNDQIVQPNGDVAVSIKIPDDYDMNSLGFYYLPPNDEPMELECKLKHHSFILQMSHFSTYIIAQKIATDTVTENKPDTAQNKPTSPKTGDNSNTLLWYALLIISGGVLTILAITFKRHIKNNLM